MSERATQWQYTPDGPKTTQSQHCIGAQEWVKENENLQICLTLFLLVCPYGIVQQNIQFILILEGIIKKKTSYERRNYESVDEKSLS